MTLVEAETLLNGLPSSASAVADLLVAAGVTGVQGQETCCPFARHLRRELDLAYVSVDIEEIVMIDMEGNRYEVTTPASVARFITAFDWADTPYSDLIDLDGPTEDELAEIVAEQIEESEVDLTEYLYV